MNASNAQPAVASDEPLPSTHRSAPGVDGFGPIHKALRYALADLLIAMGRASFLDDAQVERVLADLEDVLAFVEDHLRHEDDFVFPVLAARLSGTLDAMASAHSAHTQMVAELRALSKAAREASASKRALVGRTLYLHYSVFVGEALVHMAEEERVLQPLLERLFTEEEIFGISARIQASLSPSEVARVTRFVMGAVIESEGRNQ